MNRYESYKPSDIDWVGEIPTHWETVQPKYKLNRVTRPIDDEDEVITCFRDGVVTLRKNRREDGFTNSIKEHGYQQIHPGDLVVHEMDGFAGAIGISDSKGKSTPVYTVVEPDDRTDLKYIAYLLREMSQTGKIESLARSIRERTTDFRWNMWSVIHFPFPSVKEQKLISRYLDKKTSQIDSLVEKIQKKSELLKEQRTSLINHYVTKGLDPNAEMKDSGIEWVGETPSHWDIVSTKRLFKTYFGGSWGDEPEDNQVDNIVKVVRVTEFDMNYLEVTKEIPTLRSLKLSKESPKLLKNGDLILEKSGGGEKTPVGRVVLYHKHNNERVVNSNFTNVCRPNIELVDPQFSVFLLSSLYSGGATVRNIKQTTGIQNLDLDGFMSEKVSLPPLNEQTEISSRIILSNNFIQNLIQKNLEKINLLTEYRQSLISSIVTGKVRVTEDMI